MYCADLLLTLNTQKYSQVNENVFEQNRQQSSYRWIFAWCITSSQCSETRRGFIIYL